MIVITQDHRQISDTENLSSHLARESIDDAYFAAGRMIVLINF